MCQKIFSIFKNFGKLKLYKGLKPSVDICRNDNFLQSSYLIFVLYEIYQMRKRLMQKIDIFCIKKIVYKQKDYKNHNLFSNNAYGLKPHDI